MGADRNTAVRIRSRDEVERHLGRRAEELAQPARVLKTRKLHEDAVSADALDARFGHTDLVDALATICRLWTIAWSVRSRSPSSVTPSVTLLSLATMSMSWAPGLYPIPVTAWRSEASVSAAFVAVSASAKLATTRSAVGLDAGRPDRRLAQRVARFLGDAVQPIGLHGGLSTSRVSCEPPWRSRPSVTWLCGSQCG